jgi:hypothetical protein
LRSSKCQESLLYPDVFGLPVYYITTDWEEALRPEQDTWPEVRDLLQAVATRHDRWDQLCEIDTHHEHSKLRIGPGTSSVDQQGSRAETLSWALHGAIRRCKRLTGALIVGKGWYVGADGEQRRRIELRQDDQKKTTWGQLAKLEKALNSKSADRIEAAYWGLTAPTIELTKQAVIDAGPLERWSDITQQESSWRVSRRTIRNCYDWSCRSPATCHLAAASIPPNQGTNSCGLSFGPIRR